MLRSARTLAILFVLPPITLLAMSHLAPSRTPEWVWYGVLVALGAAAIAGIRTSNWSDAVQVLIGTLYVIAAIPLLPLLALLAICTTGNCL